MRLSPPKWQKILSQGFKTHETLLAYLGLAHPMGSHAAEQIFATRVPLSFAQRMTKQNPNDPLLLQVLAQSQELNVVQGYHKDPLLESSYNKVPGLIHKYPNRVLLTLTGACAINCRYCFRRHFPYQDNNPSLAGWEKAISYIAQNNEIDEVILSGGDPLIASDKRLGQLFNCLANIPHLKTLRIHTRMPVVLPERIDSDFIELLKNLKLNKVMVFHINHPQEINSDVESMCQRLSEVGVLLLNQSVLLKGVNNESEVLATLSRRLFACKIMPYYLHILDKVDGAAHFDIPLFEAQAIYKELQSKLSGYLVPKMAIELPGVLHKTLVQ